MIKKKEQYRYEMEIEQRFVWLGNNFQRLFSGLIERENRRTVLRLTRFYFKERRNLKDENLALRLEIADLKEI